MKKLLSITLAVVMLLCLLPAVEFTALATEELVEGYYTYTVSNGEATVTGYTDYTHPTGDLVIPSTLGRYPVTSIADNALSLDASVTSVTIPNGVTTIGNKAFYRCERLRKVTIPNSVTSIGDLAFADCSALPSITLGRDVASIGKDVFYKCNNFTSIMVSENNAHFSAEDGVLFNKTKSTLLLFPYGKAGAYTVPDGVTNIEASAFSHCPNLTSVFISDSVTEIGKMAFCRCKNLSSVTIGDGVTAFGDLAFGYCDSLASVSLGAGVTSIPFYNCSSLSSITVSENNVYFSVEDNVLFNKEKTELVLYPDGKAYQYRYVIPDGVTSIGDSAFANCDNFTRITIPDSVTSIGDRAFYWCSNLTSITIGNGVTSIGRDAFESCHKLTSIVIPDSVTSIDGDAFRYCYNLTSIKVSNNNAHYCSQDGVLFNKAKSILLRFPEGKAGDYTVPDGVTDIGECAFWQCISLTSITIPKSVTSIGESAFSDCRALETVWYGGSETEKEQMSIGSGNGLLLSATWGIACPNGGGGHTYEWIIDQAATCVTDGVKHEACSKCHLVQSENSVIPATGEHEYDDFCDAVCNICDNTRIAPHNYEWIVDTPETCGKTGTKHEECIVCHAKRSENTTILATGDHKYDNDCDTTCNICGGTRKIVHSYVWVVDTEPTCGGTGSKHEECIVCQTKRNEGTSIPATEQHAFEWITDEAESCGKDGTKHEECTACHTTRSEGSIIPATGNHIYEWVIDTPETCGQTGAKHEECIVCHAKRSEDTTIPATGDHKYDNDCDTTCNICGSVRTIVHQYEWVVDTEPTCGGTGSKHEECTVCHTKRSEGTSTPATGDHKYDNTCDTTCNQCGDVRAIRHTYASDTETICQVCRYERKMYTIFYNGNGWDGAPTEQIKPEGETVTLKTMDNEDFWGWSTTPYGEVVVGAEQNYQYSEDADVTFYAVWVRYCTFCYGDGKKTTYETMKVSCSRCGGDGKVSSSTEKHCRSCGSTNISKDYGYSSGTGINSGYKCNSCGAQMTDPAYYSSCSTCGGSGKVIKDVQVEIDCNYCGGIGYNKTQQNPAPAPKLQDRTKYTVTLVYEEGVDYSKDGEIWQTSNVFENLDPDKSYYFYMRYRENAVHTTGPAGNYLFVRSWNESVASLVITKKPNKLIYSTGEAFDATGLVVTAYYNNNTSEDITYYVDISGYSSTAGTKTITVRYLDKTATFEVEVKDYTPGDIDGVEGINDRDAVYLLMHSFFPEDYPLNQSGDFDGDNDVDDRDAVYLLMHSFFPDDYPLKNK